VAGGFRLSRNEHGLAPVDYDDHVLPGEAVLLNGQPTYAAGSANPYKTSVPPPPPALTKDDLAGGLYAHGGHSWGDGGRPVDDCPTCREAQPTTGDDSEVCFREELVRRKLLLGRCPATVLGVEPHYDSVLNSSRSDVFMTTFRT